MNEDFGCEVCTYIGAAIEYEGSYLEAVRNIFKDDESWANAQRIANRHINDCMRCSYSIAALDPKAHPDSLAFLQKVGGFNLT